MYEKLVTFEEEKRKEHLYLLYNSIFICACLICFFEPIFSILMLPFKGIEDENVRWVMDTLLKPLCLSAAALCPFFIYNIRMQRSFRKSLMPENNKVPLIFYVLGILSVAAIVPFFVFLGEKFCDMLIADGYIIYESVIDFGQSSVANIFYIVYTSAVTAFLLDLAFRGVAAEKLSHAHPVAALLVPALVAAIQPVSLFKFPYVFASAVVTGWGYLKTHSLWLSISMSFAANAVFYVTQLLKQAAPELYESNLLTVSIALLVVGIAAFAVLAVKTGWKIVRPEPVDSDEEYDRLNGKQAFVGFIKAFGLWIMIFIFLFRIFFTYLDKPMPEMDSGETASAHQIETES